MQKLYFGFGNAKLPKTTAHFSLPSGWACPFAKDCKSVANRKTGKIKDGEHCRFRCFSASAESLFINTRVSRWNNLDILSGLTQLQMQQLFKDSIAKFPKRVTHLRLHIAGDFFSEIYFAAWRETARVFPWLTFYAYTKSLPYWIRSYEIIPPNFVLTASYGGERDDLITAFGLKSAVVVFSEQETRDKGLEIDHDDTHAWKDGKSFALLLHGVQPKDTDAAKAANILRRGGVLGYSRKKGGRQIQ